MDALIMRASISENHGRNAPSLTFARGVHPMAFVAGQGEVARLATRVLIPFEPQNKYHSEAKSAL
jgi:hypothetical protein